jgi:hypothetical protein
MSGILMKTTLTRSDIQANISIPKLETSISAPGITVRASVGS